LGALAVSIGACGGGGGGGESKTPIETHNQDEPMTGSKHTMSGPAVSQELGEIDKKEAEQAIAKVQPQIVACQKSASSRIDYVAGELRVFVRVDANGQTRWSYFEGSTVGDRTMEKCVLDVLGKTAWPKPKGGEAEVRKSFAFDAGDAREPTNWSPDKMADAIAKSQGDVDKCKEGVKGSFAVTAYVVPDGKNGKVEAAGAAPPNKEGEAKVDCIVGVVKSMKAPSPGSYAAKVSFSL
jgi:hypothetical protein